FDGPEKNLSTLSRDVPNGWWTFCHSFGVHRVNRRSLDVLSHSDSRTHYRTLAITNRNYILRLIMNRSLLDRKMILQATAQAFLKLDPRVQIRNPVMFITQIGAILTTIYA